MLTGFSDFEYHEMSTNRNMIEFCKKKVEVDNPRLKILNPIVRCKKANPFKALVRVNTIIFKFWFWFHRMQGVLL